MNQRGAPPIRNHFGRITTRGGVYEQAFGVDGTLYDRWSDDTFEQTLVAVVFWKDIESQMERAKKKDRKYIYLRRLRYFALASRRYI